VYGLWTFLSPFYGIGQFLVGILYLQFFFLLLSLTFEGCSDRTRACVVPPNLQSTTYEPDVYIVFLQADQAFWGPLTMVQSMITCGALYRTSGYWIVRSPGSAGSDARQGSTFCDRVKADGKHGLSGIVEQHNLLPLLLNRILFKNFMNSCVSRNKPWSSDLQC